MKIKITEYLEINLEDETWCCSKCNHKVGPARKNYKEGLLVYARDPREVHRPILNPDLYEYTFSPDPNWLQIVEYYCPECSTMMEVEYLPPGHPPQYDMQFDIDALQERYKGKREG
ncbi:acetone carboxylase subunit gamma [Alkalihalobacterium alkalinitrilicum]|uniref:acetone carboxylase subunit gamma n=1 Tax=Alkalihalobacterium alkalinitrilicum TaxID=427920 RepID=UPI0009957E07|nr:acetone carboxylase subunit gamma [Alkalihalobacterium alkalinitrilicum]